MVSSSSTNVVNNNSSPNLGANNNSPNNNLEKIEKLLYGYNSESPFDGLFTKSNNGNKFDNNWKANIFC